MKLMASEAARVTKTRTSNGERARRAFLEVRRERRAPRAARRPTPEGAGAALNLHDEVIDLLVDLLLDDEAV